MSDKKRKVPKLRFPGFTDAWEQRKLGEVFSERSERSGDGDLISVTINSGVVRFEDLDRKDNSSEDKSNYKVVKIGDIAYNSMRMWQGASGYSPYNGILSPAYTVIVPNSGYYSKFFAFDFKRFDRIQIFKSNSQGLTSDTWNLKYPALSLIKVLSPEMEEQIAIADFLTKFDTLISLHQRKLDNVKMLKKSLLQKLFPKDGEKIPELRFPGFTDAWEQRKLGDVVEKCYGGGTPQTSVEEYWTGNIPWLQSSNLVDDDVQSVKIEKYISKEAIDKSAAKMIPSHSIAIVTRVGIGKLVLMDESYTTSQDFLSLSNVMLKKQFMLYALYLLLKNEKRKGQGTSIKGITKEALLGKSIRFPKTSIEQHQIGNFVKLFDSLISLHQRKLDHLKELKKGLLQQMFV